MKYPIHERFFTFQGEGFYMGVRAFFVRLFGCPVHCPWCDSAGTWHKDWVPDKVEKMEARDIIEEVPKNCRYLVITGGEPCVHDLDALIIEARTRGLFVMIETSGGFHFKGGCRPDWICLSPKKWHLPVPGMLALANEFKIIVEEPADVEFYLSKIIPHVRRFDEKTVWLHPEWSKRNDTSVLDAIIQQVKYSPLTNLRAGWQLHKLFSVDALDDRSRKLVPLGGDQSKGY